MLESADLFDQIGPQFYKYAEPADAFYFRQFGEFLVGGMGPASQAGIDHFKFTLVGILGHCSHLHLCQQQLYIDVIWNPQPHQLPYDLVIRVYVNHPPMHPHLPFFIGLCSVAAW